MHVLLCLALLAAQPKAETVRGVLLDPDGSPAAGVTVLLVPQAPDGQVAVFGLGPSFPAPLARTVTDAQGGFGFTFVRVNDACFPWLLARRDDGAAVLARLFDGAARLRFRLTRARLVGRVEQADGQPPPSGTRVMVSGNPDLWYFVPVSADGGFVADGLNGAKKCTLLVCEPALGPGRGHVSAQLDRLAVRSDGDTTVKLVTGARRLTGRVVDLRGQAVGGCLVRCQGAVVRTAADGTFAFERMMSGKETLDLPFEPKEPRLTPQTGHWIHGGMETLRWLTVEIPKDRDPPPLTVTRFEQCARLEVKRHDGAPAASLSLLVVHRSSGGGEGRATWQTDKSGRAIADLLNAGTDFRAFVRHPDAGYAWVHWRDFEELARTQPVALRLRAGGTVRGRYVDRATRRPVGGVEVALSVLQWTEGFEGLAHILFWHVPDRPEPHIISTLTSDNDGRFQLGGLPLGTSFLGDRSIVVERDGQVFDWGDVPVEVGPAAELSGSVLDAKGRPLADRTLDIRFCRGDDWRLDGQRRVVTDSRGRFTLWPFARGTATVIVTAPTVAGEPSAERKVRIPGRATVWQLK